MIQVKIKKIISLLGALSVPLGVSAHQEVTQQSGIMLILMHKLIHAVGTAPLMTLLVLGLAAVATLALVTRRDYFNNQYPRDR